MADPCSPWGTHSNWEERTSELVKSTLGSVASLGAFFFAFAGDFEPEHERVSICRLTVL